MEMPEVATVTSRSMINIPARIRRKYGLQEGSKVVFVDSESGIRLVPVPSLSQLFGIDKKKHNALLEGIRELELEHRREAKE